MDNQVLSIEQMQELKELGIDTSKASMLWYPKMAIDVHTGKGYVESHYVTINRIDSEHFWNTREGKETVPTFTLQDILEILPQSFYVEKNTTSLDKKAFLQINKTAGGGYSIAYEQSWDEDNKLKMKMHGQQLNESLLLAAFNMLKWCKQNNYISSINLNMTYLETSC